MHTVFLSLGSNLGDRKHALIHARAIVSTQFTDVRVSSIYETEPWGNTDQPRFLNFCLSGKTELTPTELLAFIKQTEVKLGRQKRDKWGPREIDIDILFYDQEVIDSPELQIPHPDIDKRAFVLVPLSEIAPDFIHPILGKTIAQLKDAVDTNTVSKFVQKTRVMAILNATPDSFSDGGELNSERIKQVIEQGADIIDIGGESTRPGFTPVDAKEEIKRVIPVIKAVRSQNISIHISIDTQKARVAEAALEAGATIINDISALSDPDMAKVAIKHKCPIILMRNQGIKQDVIKETKAQFEQIITHAQNLGIQKDQIILDPGLGFGDLKTQDFKALPGGNVEVNLELTRRIKDYSLGFPVLIGGSRKRFIGEMMNEPDPKKRLSGSLELAQMAAQAGAAIIRVHDVKETIAVLR